MADVRSDAELLAAHVAGDRSAFATLFARHRNRLWSVALRTMGDPVEAEDALQDALLAIHRHAEKYRGDAALTTWMHRIVVNACLDRLRKRANRPTVPLISADGEYEHEIPDPIDIADLSSLRIDLRAALDRLPMDQRLCIVLVDIEGYPVERVAEMLNCPVGTVKSRCSRGRARLARDLRDRDAAEGTTGEQGASNPPTGTPQRPHHE